MREWAIGFYFLFAQAIGSNGPEFCGVSLVGLALLGLQMPEAHTGAANAKCRSRQNQHITNCETASLFILHSKQNPAFALLILSTSTFIR
jgi:hypothetical protein